MRWTFFDKLHGYSRYKPALINVTVYLSLFVSFLYRYLCSITFLSHIEKFKMGAESATGHATPIPPSVSTLEMHVFLNPHFLDVTFYIIEKYNSINVHWGTSCLSVYLHAFSINHVAKPSTELRHIDIRFHYLCTFWTNKIIMRLLQREKKSNLDFKSFNDIKLRPDSIHGLLFMWY